MSLRELGKKEIRILLTEAYRPLTQRQIALRINLIYVTTRSLLWELEEEGTIIRSRPHIGITGRRYSRQIFWEIKQTLPL